MVKFAKRHRAIEVVLEPPPLNLVNGKFRKKVADDDYEGRYRIQLRLLDDESPIKRAELTLINKRTERPAGRYVMPVLFWQYLAEQLPLFLEDVFSELSRRGVAPSSFKRPKGS